VARAAFCSGRSFGQAAALTEVEIVGTEYLDLADPWLGQASDHPQQAAPACADPAARRAPARPVGANPLCVKARLTAGNDD
jgi:hypothetical protein